MAEGGERHALATRLIGQYNVSNLLGVIGAMRALGVPLADAVRGLRRPAAGARPHGAPAASRASRWWRWTMPTRPMRWTRRLQALRPLAAQRGGQLWCVFGCGGDRDPIKRPLMAAVAEKNADRVVVTSDNPRSEKPEAIISQILLGLRAPRCVQVQADRAPRHRRDRGRGGAAGRGAAGRQGPRGLPGDRAA